MVDLVIAQANSWADRWAAWMLAASLDAAVLLALAGLAWSALRRRAAPQVGYGLFLLVPLKLLMPVVVTAPEAVARCTPSGLAAAWLGADRGNPAPAPFPASLPRDADVRDVAVAPAGPVPPSRPIDAKPLPPMVATDKHPDERTSPAATVPAGPVGGRSRPSAAALALIAWLVGVAVLSGRLALSQFRFRARLRHASPLDEAGLGVDLEELRRIAGVPRATRFVEHDSLAAPAAWGIVRPTIILPRGIAASLTAGQLRWVLLHELAHVRRGDLSVLLLQRLAAILHFFNPTIWVANRMIDQLREYACDDLATALGHASGVESGEAFVRVLRHAERGRRGLGGALGIFGLDSRASCLRRARRLLDADRPIRTAQNAWSLAGLALLAVVSLPHLRASEVAGQAVSPPPVQEAAAPIPPAPKAEAPDRAADGLDFELRVVGPGGKPVPDALVNLRTSPAPTADRVRHGVFVKHRADGYGSDIKTDAEGLVAVKFPGPPAKLDVFITTPGYGPYWTSWSTRDHGQSIPAAFTAELEAGWSVGGVVVDDSGKPIEGAKVHPSIEFRKRPGDAHQLRIGNEMKTDAAGKWRFDSVPASMGEVHVAVDHPGSMPLRRTLTRGEFGLEPGREPSVAIALDRGLTVVGKVTDEDGRPISGALIRTKFYNEIREARTGDDGTYQLTGCEPREAKLVVSAKGRATDMVKLKVEPEMGPVDFRMKPGGTVRIRVTDEAGTPLPRARIFFQRWRGPFSYFEFDHVDDYADEKGVWVWNEAPLDEFQADICPPGDGLMQLTYQPLMPREEEYVFRLPAALVISGKVIDAETKEPIKEFRVVPGSKSDGDRLFWSQRESFLASGGRYRLREDRGSQSNLVRIEAEGYQAAVSRDIASTEGNITIDFELVRGRNIAAKVVTPGLLPAVGAKVALGIAGSQINVTNGEIDDGSTFAARAATDAAGRFHFPAQDKGFQLVITHPSGYAQIQSPAEWDTVKIIRLEPWARVEGTFRVGKEPVANAPIAIRTGGRDSFGADAPRIFTHHDVTTGPGGRFVFERVIPGPGRIGRRIMLSVEEGAADVTSAFQIPAEFPAGKTTRIDLGGSGRAVVGRLQPPDGFEGKVRWNFALATAAAADPEARADGAFLTATIDRAGTFRIDDVPAGNYSLSVRFDREGVGRLHDHRFAVPPEADPGSPPIDLGTLKLDGPTPR